jgi:hypothetical protein
MGKYSLMVWETRSSKSRCGSQAWWVVPTVPGLGLRYENRDFRVSMSYLAGSWLKKLRGKEVPV